MEEMLTSEAELLNKLRHKHIIDFKGATARLPCLQHVLFYYTMHCLITPCHAVSQLPAWPRPISVLFWSWPPKDR